MANIDTSNPLMRNSSNGVGSQGNSGADEIGADAFLRMVITQMQNQDPTKPMDSQQFLGQLAEFSSVTGLQQLQQSFDGLAASLSSNQALQGANLVGKDVTIPSEVGYLPAGEEASMSGQVNVDAAEADVQISIYNQSGELVAQLPQQVAQNGRVEFNWDGTNAEGEAMPPGQYEVRAQAIVGGSSIANEVLMHAQVDSVSVGQLGQPLQLNLTGLGTISLGQVREIG